MCTGKYIFFSTPHFIVKASYGGKSFGKAFAPSLNNAQLVEEIEVENKEILATGHCTLMPSSNVDVELFI